MMPDVDLSRLGMPLPTAHDAEQATLGALLIDNSGRAWSAVQGVVESADFAYLPHRALFRHIATEHANGRPCDPISLGPVARSDPALADAGGAPWLMRLAEAAQSIVNVEGYARLVRDCRQRRDAIAEIDRARGRLFDVGDDDAQRIAATTLSRLQPIADGTGTPSRLISWPALDGVDVPAREWLVADWIPHGVVTAIYGDGGTGKTLAGQMLMTAAAIDGGTWLGIPVTRCRSFGVFSDELHRRQARIADHYRIRLADLTDMLCLSRVGENNHMVTFAADGEATLTPFWYEIRKRAKAHGARLILLDTLSELYPGDQNNAATVRAFVNQCCGRLARDCGAAVLLTAHPSLSGMSTGSGTGGSTQWNNSVRSRLYLTRPKPADGDNPDDNARTMTREKANYAASGAGTEIRLRWERGVFIPEGSDSGGMVEAIEKRTRKQQAQDAFLDGLRQANDGGRDLSDRKNGAYAPKELVQYPACKGFRIADLEQAMSSLFADKRIAMVPFGPPSRGRKRLQKEDK
jgi:RecA-family ATPase